MDYTTLITSEHRNKPNFVAAVDATANQLGANADAANSLVTMFDVDIAVGEQLDFIGEWVGVPRRIDVPLDIYFSWNTTNLGWNQGYWKGPHDDGTQTVFMDDDTYRMVLRTMIAANHWDGSFSQYLVFMQLCMPHGNHFRASDNQNMTFSVTVTGPTLPAVLQSVIQSGVLSQIRPAGVHISSFTFP